MQTAVLGYSRPSLREEEETMITASPISAPQRGARWRMPVLVLGLLLLLVGAVIVSSGVGPARISPGQVLAVLTGRSQAEDIRAIVLGLRLPRALAAAVVGAGLSAAGVLFQGLFRNPLADPFVLGSSGGAALGGAAAILLIPSLTFAGFGATALCAFLGSNVAIAIVYGLASLDRRASVTGMLLAGFVVGTMLNAITSGLVLWQESNGGMGARILGAWLHGEISAPSWTELEIVFALAAAGLAAAAVLAERLNTFALGDDYAQQLGLNLEHTRIGIVVTASLLTAVAVCLSGIVGFVGLLIPHLVRLVQGPDHRRLLPVSALGGAVFLVIADTFARSIRPPYELPVGILTAILGGPAFLYVLRRHRHEVYL
jgi:iron complex transport system permease protein